MKPDLSLVNALPSFLKSATHAPEGNSALVVADQYGNPGTTLVNGWPVGKDGLKLTVSITLVSSTTEGSRQPFHPLTGLSRQVLRVSDQYCRGFVGSEIKHTQHIEVEFVKSTRSL